MMSTAVILRDVRPGMKAKNRADRGRRMWDLYRNGKHSAEWVAARFNVDVSTVYRWVARFDEAEGNLVDRGMLDALAERKAVSST
jgi:hypothetical protein